MKVKDIVLAVAVVVLTIFVTFYGINTFFPKAQYEDFCGDYDSKGVVETEAACLNVGGKWTPQDIRCITEPCPQGYCDVDYTCRQAYDDANALRGGYVFVIALILGVLIIVLGLRYFGLEAVGAGLMGGGVGTLIYGSGAYWPYTQNWARFALSLVGLVALIWFSYYLSKKGSKKGKK